MSYTLFITLGVFGFALLAGATWWGAVLLAMFTYIVMDAISNT